MLYAYSFVKGWVSALFVDYTTCCVKISSTCHVCNICWSVQVSVGHPPICRIHTTSYWVVLRIVFLRDTMTLCTIWMNSLRYGHTSNFSGTSRCRCSIIDAYIRHTVSLFSIIYSTITEHLFFYSKTGNFHLHPKRYVQYDMNHPAYGSNIICYPAVLACSSRSSWGSFICVIVL